MIKPWTAIAAMSENRVIGDGDDMPWNLPEDLKWFKQTTKNNTIVMGRNTYESIGRPLPKRLNLVLTRKHIEIPGCTVINSLDALESNLHIQGKVFIVGGGEVYRLALPYCSDIFMTHVYGNFPGSVCFPEFEDQFHYVETLKETDRFAIKHYRNNICSNSAPRV